MIVTKPWKSVNLKEIFKKNFYYSKLQATATNNVIFSPAVE